MQSTYQQVNKFKCITYFQDFLHNNYFPLINVDPILSGFTHALSQEIIFPWLLDSNPS